MASVISYINFVDKSKEAVDFYKYVFGGDAEIQEDGGSVVQLEFKAGDIHFMGSDLHNDQGVIGTSAGYSIVLNCDSEEQLQEFYRKLGEGGKSVFEPVDSGWGAIVAHCADRFGVSWMLNYDKPQS